MSIIVNIDNIIKYTNFFFNFLYFIFMFITSVRHIFTSFILQQVWYFGRVNTIIGIFVFSFSFLYFIYSNNFSTFFIRTLYFLLYLTTVCENQAICVAFFFYPILWFYHPIWSLPSYALFFTRFFFFELLFLVFYFIKTVLNMYSIFLNVMMVMNIFV